MAPKVIVDENVGAENSLWNLGPHDAASQTGMYVTYTGTEVVVLEKTYCDTLGILCM